MDVDASMIVAVTGVAAFLAAQITDRRGRRQRIAQEAAADRLARRDQEFTQQGLIIDRLTGELQRSDAARQAERQACVETRADMSQTIVLLVGTVRSEIAAEAAQISIDRSARHDGTHHSEDG